MMVQTCNQIVHSNFVIVMRWAVECGFHGRLGAPTIAYISTLWKFMALGFPFWSRGRSFEYIQMINIDENFNSFVETEEKLRKTTKEIQQHNSVP